jgi:hypothetical protein
MRATKAHFRSLNGDDGRLAHVFVNLLISEFVVRLPWLPM